MSNEDTVRKGYEAFGQGDMDTLRSIMTPDVIQSVPGKSRVSGDHKGVDNVLGYYAKLFELTGGTLMAELQTRRPKAPTRSLRFTSSVLNAGQELRPRRDAQLHVHGREDLTVDEEHGDQAAFDDFFA